MIKKAQTCEKCTRYKKFVSSKRTIHLCRLRASSDDPGEIWNVTREISVNILQEAKDEQNLPRLWD